MARGQETADSRGQTPGFRHREEPLKDKQTWRLLVVATHPVQYLSPWWRELAQRPDIELCVWYVTLPDAAQQGVGFDQEFTWDVPLLEGYPWREISNHAAKPGLDAFFGTRVRGQGSLLSQLRPDAVLLTGWHQWSLIQIAISCYRLGIPRLVRGDSNDLGSRSRWKVMLQRMLLRLYDRFLYTGEANKTFYLGRGIESSRLFSCPAFCRQPSIRRSKRPPHGSSRIAAPRLGRWTLTIPCSCLPASFNPKNIPIT